MKDENGASFRDFARRWVIVLVVSMAGTLVGCARPLAEPVRQPFSPAKHRQVRIQSCVDQSAYKGSWNLAAETTRALTDRVLATGRFDFAPEPALIFSCDVEGVVDRNAFQRGVLPDWSLAQVRVTMTAWEKPGDKLIAVFRGFAALAPGDMSLSGAEKYLVGNAANQIGVQLEAWVNGIDKSPR